MFERFTSSLRFVFVLVFEYISRTSSKRASAASVITSAVHSYLRFIPTAGVPSIFYSSISSSSRDFNRFMTIRIRISIWIYIYLSNFDNRSERSERYNIRRPFLPTVHSYGWLASIFYSSISSSSRDFTTDVREISIVSWRFVFEYISLELRQSKRAQRAL